MLVRNERHPREGMPLFLLYLRYFCPFVNEIGDFVYLCARYHYTKEKYVKIISTVVVEAATA